MSDPLYAFPTACAQTLRALARYPSRTAFAWPGGSITYAGATDLIGRMQKVFMRLGLQPGARVAFLTANRADTWCAGVAAQLSRLCDHLAASAGLARRSAVPDRGFRSRGAGRRRRHLPRSRRRARRQGARPEDRVHARPGRLRRRSAGRGRGRRHAPAPRCLAGPDDIATLNYTGGTTGKSKGALRHHREHGGFANAILADFEIPGHAALSHGGADQPRRRHQGAADADARRHRAHAQGLRSGGGVQDHRARAHQFHAVRADHDLRAARSSRARQDRSLLARAAALRRLARCRRAGWSRASSGSGRCSRSSTARPNAIRSRCCARPTTIRRRRSCSCPAAFRSPPARSRFSTTTTSEVATGEAGEICVRAPHVMARILEAAGTDRRDPQERLAAYRRHRARRRARLHVHPRPQEGHDRLRRLQHLSARGRGRAVAARRRRDGRRGRRARRQMGRGRHRGRGRARRRATRTRRN